MTPTARLVAAARDIRDYIRPTGDNEFGHPLQPGEEADMLASFSVVGWLLEALAAFEATPPAAAPTAEPTDEELLLAYVREAYGDINDERWLRIKAADTAQYAHGRALLAVAKEQRRLGVERERARCDRETHMLRIRLAESRALLTRMVKYVREDKARTNGATRLARLVDQVADYLTRTHDPMSILREDP